MFNEVRGAITRSYEILTKNTDIINIRNYKISRLDHHEEFFESYDDMEKGVRDIRGYLTKLSDAIEALDLRIERLKFYIERDKEVRKERRIADQEALRIYREAKAQQKKLQQEAKKVIRHKMLKEQVMSQKNKLKELKGKLEETGREVVL